MADSRLIDAVRSLVGDLGGEGKALLDVSCRSGDVLRALEPLGFERRGTNFVDEAEGLDGVPVDVPVDLLETLPYDDASFDVVLLVEVIEHLENHRHALSEIARILKPGGVLVLTTPNVLRFSSRLHFLLSGFHKTKRRFVPFATPLDEAHRFHTYPIDLPVLYYLLHGNGLRFERFAPVRTKAFNLIAFPIVWPLVALYTLYFTNFREKTPGNLAQSRRLAHLLLNPRTLLDDNLAIRLRKRDDASGGEP